MRSLAQFTKSFGCRIPYVFYVGYKNMFLDSEYRL